MNIHIDTTAIESAFTWWCRHEHIWRWHLWIAILTFSTMMVFGLGQKFENHSTFAVKWPGHAFVFGWVGLSFFTAFFWPFVLLFSPIISFILYSFSHKNAQK